MTPDDLTRRLAPIEAQDRHGAPVRLGGLWQDRTAVLAFVRHFG